MSDDSLLGAYLGEYQLESLLGQGGMARVYRGIDAQTRRVAAVKVIESSFQDDVDYRIRFEREAQAISRLHHPGIVKLYRFGEINNVIYIAMQYIEGADLASVMDTCHAGGNWLGLADVCHLARQVAAALDYAHERGVIHRDVKPSNVLVGREGQAVLTDFGLALLIEVGTRGEVFGTPYYISPEQAISSAGAVPQSDQYSLAILLYQMLTGILPFNAGNPMDTAILHMTQPPEPPSKLRPALPYGLDAVLLKSLEKKPDDRYATCLELVDDFEQACLKSPLYTQGDRSLLVESVERAMPVLPTLPVHKVDEKAARARTLASKGTLRARWRVWAALFVVLLLLTAIAAWFFLLR
jgi:eukaryotic-like serine/threonine-protein kinase